MSTLLTASFGASRSGLAGRVAYSLDGGSTWVTSGVTEPIAGSGNYQVTVSATPPFFVNWRTGDGDTVSPLIALVSGGSGYTNGTAYALGASGGSGTGFAGTFDVVNGSVGNLVVTNRGSGYSAAPTLTFPGAGSGTGASATASLTLPKTASEAVNAGGAVSLPSPAPTGYGPVGTGSVAVNQDYPTTGNLAFKTAGGQGIGGAQVRAYLASEYASNPNTAVVRGQTITLDNGGWANNINLDPGACIVTFDAPGYQTTVVTLTVS